MIEQTYQIHLFYPLLLLLITIIIITIGLVIIKKSDNKTHTDVFFKSNDNAKDVTIHVADKLGQAHTEVITLPKVYEDELHNLESSVKDVNDRLIETAEEINDKLSLLFERVAKLEHISYNKDNN